MKKLNQILIPLVIILLLIVATALATKWYYGEPPIQPVIELPDSEVSVSTDTTETGEEHFTKEEFLAKFGKELVTYRDGGIKYNYEDSLRIKDSTAVRYDTLGLGAYLRTMRLDVVHHFDMYDDSLQAGAEFDVLDSIVAYPDIPHMESRAMVTNFVMKLPPEKKISPMDKPVLMWLIEAFLGGVLTALIFGG